jgi:hypothetical protein
MWQQHKHIIIIVLLLIAENFIDIDLTVPINKAGLSVRKSPLSESYIQRSAEPFRREAAHHTAHYCAAGPVALMDALIDHFHFSIAMQT